MKKIYLYFVFLLCCCTTAYSQLLPVNQKEQNACDALVLCGNTFTSPYSYQGRGSVYDLNNTPCSGGEDNVVWIRLNVNTPGTIVFTLTPLVATDDYDLAVLDITGGSCASLTTANVIRCNFNNNQPGSNVNGAIGLNNTSTINFVTGGSFGNSFLQQINANAGDVYLIMINNFGYYTGIGGPSSGFTIDFTGSTATFNQPPPPEISYVMPYCDLSKKIKLKMNQPVLCSSIAADGSDFFISPNSTSIASAVGLNCTGMAGYTDEIELTFTSTLPNGFYDVNAKVGTDGNSILGLCNVGIALPHKKPFQVGLNPIEIASLDTPACQFLTLRFNTPFLCSSVATNGSDFEILGPSNVGIVQAMTVGCNSPNAFIDQITLRLSSPIYTDGVYTIRSKTGTDLNTLLDTCGRTLPVGRTINFTINSYNGKLKATPDGLACYFDMDVNLTGTNSGKAPSTGFQYNWTSISPIQNPSQLNAIGKLTQLTNHFILQTVDSFGCVLRDSANITVKTFTGKVSPETSIVCENEAIQLVASGGVSYSWKVVGGNALLDYPNQSVIFAQPSIGIVNLDVAITNDRGCIDTQHVMLDVKPNPIVSISPRDTTIKYGDAIMLRAVGAERYYWHPLDGINDPNSPNPIIKPEEDRWISVMGENEYNCPARDSIFIKIDYTNTVYFPNAFTPNGDGLNDEFGPVNFVHERLINFVIYNRYGNEVFQTSTKGKHWDGTINGKPAPVDVYYYLMEYGHRDDTHQKITGDVTLLR